MIKIIYIALAILLTSIAITAEGASPDNVIGLYYAGEHDESLLYRSDPLYRSDDDMRLFIESLQLRHWPMRWFIEFDDENHSLNDAPLNNTPSSFTLVCETRYDGPLDLSPHELEASRPHVLLLPTRGLTVEAQTPSVSWLGHLFGGETPHRRSKGDDNPPNLVMLMIDTLRADHAPPHEHPFLIAPHMEMLAALGVAFEQSYGASSSTRPSVGTIFTGLHPRAHGAERHALAGARLHGGVPVMAEWMLKREYYTAAVSSNAQITSAYGFGRGFETFLCPVREYQVTPLGNAQLRKLHEPFFLYLHYIAPHQPYTPPQRYASLYQGLTPYPELDAYCAEITFEDRRVGRILAELARQDLLNRTILWLLSDHGEEFWEHGWNGHGSSLYEEQIRTTSIVTYPPRIHMGKKESTFHAHDDILPTAQALLGATPEQPVHGVDLSPLLLRDADPSTAPPQRPLFLHHGGGLQIGPHESDKQGVLLDSQKLIWWTEKDDWELYDLADDPIEQMNLYDRLAEQTPDTITLMKTLLRERLSESARFAEQFLQDEDRNNVELSPAELRNLRDLGYIQ